MALGYTYVDYEELARTIDQLKRTKDSLGTKIKKIKGIIDGSVNNPQIYKSDDARITLEQFEEMYNKWAQKFDNYVQEYIDYFNAAKLKYEERVKIEGNEAQKLNSFID